MEMDTAEDSTDTRDTVDAVVADLDSLDSLCRPVSRDPPSTSGWEDKSWGVSLSDCGTATLPIPFGPNNPPSPNTLHYVDYDRVGPGSVPNKRKSSNSTSLDGSAKKLMKAEGGCDEEAEEKERDMHWGDMGRNDSFDGDILNPGETMEDADKRDEWIDRFKSMSIQSQQVALRHLIGVLPDSHIRSMRYWIEPLFQKDFLSLLPGELSLMIVSQLRPSDITSAARVCKKWQRICEDDRMWKKKCLREGYDRMDEPSFRFNYGWEAHPATSCPGITVYCHLNPREALANRIERENAYGRCHDRSPWKSLYLRKSRIVSNWKTRPIQSTSILKGHDDHVITCLQIQGDRIVTGSDDNTLKVWHIEHANAMFSLVGHLGGVWTSQISEDGQYIVSGSTDRTVRVWSGHNGHQLHVLQGHTSTVRCMSLHGHTLVSGSRDHTLRVWDIHAGILLRVLTGHLAAVRCVQFDGKRVVSGAYDFTVKIWDVDSGECVHTLTGHTNRVYSLLFEPERNLVISGSLDTTIRVWDIEKGTCIAILVGHSSLTSGMQLRGNTLVSCNADSDVRVWDITEGGSCRHRLHGTNGHMSAITSLQMLDNGVVATSSDDGSVKLWDVEKGTFIRDLVKLSSGGSGGCIWRLKATDTLLVCAVGSRNGTEDTKLILIDFDASYP